jgi:hypothetical protein
MARVALQGYQEEQARQQQLADGRQKIAEYNARYEEARARNQLMAMPKSSVRVVPAAEAAPSETSASGGLVANSPAVARRTRGGLVVPGTGSSGGLNIPTA